MADDETLLDGDSGLWINNILRANLLLERLLYADVLGPPAELQSVYDQLYEFSTTPHAAIRVLRSWLEQNKLATPIHDALTHISVAADAASDGEWARQYDVADMGTGAVAGGVPAENLCAALRCMAEIPRVCEEPLVVLFAAGVPLALAFELGWELDDTVSADEMRLYAKLGADNWSGSGDELMATVRAQLHLG